MKKKNFFGNALKTVSLAGCAIVALSAIVNCDNKDYTKDSPVANVVYLDVAKVKDVSNFTFNRTIEAGQQTLSAQLMRPAEADIGVVIKADASQVDNYNARLGTNYAMLESKYYKFSAQQVVIKQGKIASEPVTVDFSGLTELEIDEGYLLPVTIDHVSDGMGTLGGSKTICYVVRRSSAITSAVSLKNNYFNVPGFDKGSETANVVNNLKQLTYEAIIRVNSFKNGTNAREISSIMGIEQYCLFRFGDAGFNPQQLQFSYKEIKFPKADKGKLLNEGEWYHVAVTFDTEKKEAVIYVDGREQSRIENYGTGEPINLGMQERGKDFMFKIGHSYGDSDDMTRMLDGEICEVRIWNVVRSQQEIFDNMYNVEPATKGLCAYWKFNEGQGNTVHDYSGNKNDAQAHRDAVWPDGIEVTQKNKE